MILYSRLVPAMVPERGAALIPYIFLMQIMSETSDNSRMSTVQLVLKCPEIYFSSVKKELEASNVRLPHPGCSCRGQRFSQMRLRQFCVERTVHISSIFFENHLPSLFTSGSMGLFIYNT